MSITINIHLLSGEVFPFTARRSRTGIVQYAAVKDKICSAVIEHLQLSSDDYIVSLIHDDDETRVQEQWRAHVTKWEMTHTKKKKERKEQWEAHITQWARRQCRLPFPEEFDSTRPLDENTLQYIEMKRYVDRDRCYQDDDVVHVMVDRRRAWDDEKDGRE